jgi:hypothetical protein
MVYLITKVLFKMTLSECLRLLFGKDFLKHIEIEVFLQIKETRD